MICHFGALLKGICDENPNLAPKLMQVVILEFKYLKKYLLYNNKSHGISKFMSQAIICIVKIWIVKLFLGLVLIMTPQSGVQL